MTTTVFEAKKTAAALEALVRLLIAQHLIRSEDYQAELARVQAEMFDPPKHNG